MGKATGCLRDDVSPTNGKLDCQGKSRRARRARRLDSAVPSSSCYHFHGLHSLKKSTTAVSGLLRALTFLGSFLLQPLPGNFRTQQQIKLYLFFFLKKSLLHSWKQKLKSSQNDGGQKECFNLGNNAQWELQKSLIARKERKPIPSKYFFYTGASPPPPLFFAREILSDQNCCWNQ